MKTQVIKNIIFKGLRGSLKYVLLPIGGFLLLFFVVLQIPFVQQKLTSIIAKKLKNQIDFEIVYDNMHIWWFDHIELNQVKILDPEKNTMIALRHLEVDFKIKQLYKEQGFFIDEVRIDGPELNIKTIMDNRLKKCDLNISIFIERLYSQSQQEAEKQEKNASAETKGFTMFIDKIKLENGQFQYNDTEKAPITDGFDYYHFGIPFQELYASDFAIISDTIQAQVTSLRGKELTTQLPIKNFTTFFRLTEKTMQFQKLRTEIGKSLIQDAIVFHFENLDSLSRDFVNNVRMDISLKDSYVHPQDLRHFTYTSYDVIEQTAFISGNATGKVGRFIVNHFQGHLGKSTVTGRLRMDGLPDVDNTFMNIDALKGTTVHINDLKPYLPDFVYERAKVLKKLDTEGNFAGFFHDFVATGDFMSDIGFIHSNINLKIDKQNVAQSLFSGGIALKDFDLGQYLDDTATFRMTSLRGNIRGKGLSRETTNFFVKGEADYVDVHHYPYTCITTEGTFANQQFEGTASCNDPNLKFDGHGYIDLRKEIEVVNIDVSVDTVFAHKIGLSKKYLFAKAHVNVNTKGIEINNIGGHITFKDLFISYEEMSLALGNVQIISSKEQENQLSLISDFLNVKVKGDFENSALIKDVKQFGNEFSMLVRNNKTEIENYYKTKVPLARKYNANMIAQLHNVNPLFILAGFDVSLSHNTLLEAHFGMSLSASFDAQFTVDTIGVSGKKFIHNKIDWSASKNYNGADVLAMFSFASKKQILNPIVSTKDLFFEAQWDSSHIDLQFLAQQTGFDTKVQLVSEASFLPDSTKIRLLPSLIRTMGKDWSIPKDNYILTNGREWFFHGVSLNHQDEILRLNGRLSEDPNEDFIIQLENLSLSLLNSLIPQKISGLTTGKIILRDIYNKPFLQNDIKIEQLSINNFLIGDVTGHNLLNTDNNQFDLNLLVNRLGEKTLVADGYYAIDNPDPLFLNCKLHKTSLKILEPFLGFIFKTLEGDVTGNFVARGNLFSLKIEGEGKIENGKVGIDYLKTEYALFGNFSLNPKQIIFKQLELTDIFQNKAVLHGDITHQNFKQFDLNLHADYQNFQLIDNKPKDNDLFYGQAFGTGNIRVTGPSDHLSILINAKTEKNTKIYLPINSDKSVVQKREFIEFVSFKEISKKNKKIKEEKTEESGYNMEIELNVEITTEAYTEIVFDAKSGDIISGYGNGAIKLQVEANGDFHIFGNYEFEKGSYNFTFRDLISKELEIEKGSRITFSGDPFSGLLNVNAAYRVLASFASVLSNQSAEVLNSPQIKKRYPVKVKLILTGTISSPQINFDIDAAELPKSNIALSSGISVNLPLEFNAFKSRMDDQELRQQVFNLILFRQFSNRLNVSGSSSIYGGLSQLFSSKVSNILKKMDENLDVDIDIGNNGTTDQESTDVQLRLSYSLLDGRLNITRDGSFGSNKNQIASPAASILGEWTIDYLLTSDGRFKVKVYNIYNRTGINQLNSSLGNPAAIIPGVSLTHSGSFNTISDLWRSLGKRKKKQIKTAPPQDAMRPEEEP